MDYIKSNHDVCISIVVSTTPKNRFFCPLGKFTCGDFTCISIVGRCDGKYDCPLDRSDEEDCRTYQNKTKISFIQLLF